MIQLDLLNATSLWRPLVDVVTEWPLALCDFGSLDIAKDLQPSDMVKRRKGTRASENKFDEIESFVAFHNPRHKWIFLDKQTFNEGWLIKLYDSKQDTAQSRSRLLKLILHLLIQDVREDLH